LIRERHSRAIDACIVVGGLHFVLFAVVAIARLTYDFDVEWMEGGELLHAVRLLEGKPIYARPSADFTAFFYTPLYPYVVAALGRPLGGISYALGRGVSLASTLATMGLLAAAVWREAGARYALLAVGMYAALDRFGGTFFDVARPDALALALAFGSAAIARNPRRDGSVVAAALLSVLAVFTKQTMAILAVAVAACLLVRDRRRGIVFCVVAIVSGGLAWLALQRATSGWFAFYVVSGHQSHGFYWANLLFYFWRDLLFLAPLLLLLPLAWGWAAYPRSLLIKLLGAYLAVAFLQRAFTLDYPPHMYFRELVYESPRVLLLLPPAAIAALLFSFPQAKLSANPETPKVGYWVWMFGASLVASAVGHATQWAYKNAFLPCALFGALLVAIASRDLAGRSPLARLATAVAIAIQLLALGDLPNSRMPDAVDRAHLVALRERLARLEGRVLVLAHPLLAYERDGRPSLHQMSLSDVQTLGGVPDFDHKAAQHTWSAVVVDDGDSLEVPAAIQQFYRPAETLDGPWMKTGVRVHPAALWIPRAER
jgi:hypothetical protein